MERVIEDLRTGGEFGASLGQACFGPFAFNLDIEQFGTDLGLRHRPEPHEPDQPVLLVIEFLQPAGECRVQLSGCRRLVGNDLRHPGANLGDEVRGQREGAVVVGDGLLHQFDWKVWQVADAFLPATANKIAVANMASTLRLGVDQAGRSPGLAAPLTKQKALQVVLVHSVALSSATARLEDFLNALE